MLITLTLVFSCTWCCIVIWKPFEDHKPLLRNNLAMGAVCFILVAASSLLSIDTLGTLLLARILVGLMMTALFFFAALGLAIQFTGSRKATRGSSVLGDQSIIDMIQKPIRSQLSRCSRERALGFCVSLCIWHRDERKTTEPRKGSSSAGLHNESGDE